MYYFNISIFPGLREKSVPEFFLIFFGILILTLEVSLYKNINFEKEKIATNQTLSLL